MFRQVQRCSIVLCLVVASVGALSTSASADANRCGPNQAGCRPPALLRWRSPRAIFDGVAATYRSIGRCPDRRLDGSPIQGVREVEIDVVFSAGGGVGDIAPVAANGSWKFVHTFETSGTVDHATVHATCLDVTNTGVVIANYRTHAISVNPPHHRHGDDDVVSDS